VVTIGFIGTYTDDSTEGDGMALAGKQAIRFKSKLRLLIPDWMNRRAPIHVKRPRVPCRPRWPEQQC